MSSPEADNDPVVRDLRDQIAATDSELVETVNKRVELVRRLKEHKAAHGLDFVDRSQEERLVDRLAAGNRGPLSEDGLRELYRTLLELTKREA
jgi:chorismate mutase / prephenate dehydratase